MTLTLSTLERAVVLDWFDATPQTTAIRGDNTFSISHNQLVERLREGGRQGVSVKAEELDCIIGWMNHRIEMAQGEIGNLADFEQYVAELIACYMQRSSTSSTAA